MKTSAGLATPKTLILHFLPWFFAGFFGPCQYVANQRVNVLTMYYAERTFTTILKSRRVSPK